jgi:dTDP-glucose pyrophosphorylase
MGSALSHAEQDQPRGLADAFVSAEIVETSHLA